MPLGKGGSQGQRLCIHTQSLELPRLPKGHQTHSDTTKGGSAYLSDGEDRPWLQATDNTADYDTGRVREGTYAHIFLR